MRDSFLAHLRATLDADSRRRLLQERARYRRVRNRPIFVSPNGAEVLNFCANNYLGLANDARLIEAAKQGLDERRLRHGVGAIHLRHADGRIRQLEQALAAFLQTDDCILYSSCFDARTAACSKRCSTRTTQSSATS